eukprot:g1415.t1
MLCRNSNRITRVGIRLLTALADGNFLGRIYEDSEHLIRPLDIRPSAWSVIWKLKRHGYEAFFVGGTVRDLCLNLPPKDIDIVTSAELKEVKSLFYRSVIVGKRFPICLVLMSSDQIEVSSFSSTLKHHSLPPDLDQTIHQNKMLEKRVNEVAKSKLPVTWSLVRSLNASSRDFSVNALMYEPCSQLLFDYVKGYNDLKRKRLRCLKEPSSSFIEDPARIFRAVRFASRLGFHIDDVTGQAMKDHAKLLLTLPQARAQLELNNILAFGSSSLAFKLMWKYEILDWVLPKHAHYLQMRGCPRDGELKDYLFTVLDALDKLKEARIPMELYISVVAMSAPLIANNVHKLKRKLQASKLNDDEKEVRQLKKLKEEDAYESLVKSTLEKMSETKGGEFIILPRGALKRARDIFQHLKLKHVYQSHGETLTDALTQRDKIAIALLKKKTLKWTLRSNLGLSIVDPNEPSLQME